MGRYDPQHIVGNIERLLRTPQAEYVDPPTDGANPSRPADARPSVPMPPTLQLFEESVLPPLGENNAVDKVRPGGRFGFFKKVWLRLLRPLAGPQAVFNAQALRGFELLANHMDLVQRRIVAAEDRAAEAENRHAEADRVHAERIAAVEAALPPLDERLRWLAEEVSRNVTKTLGEIEEVDKHVEFVKSEVDRRFKEVHGLVGAEESTRTQQIRQRFEQAEKLVESARAEAANQSRAVSDRYAWIDDAFAALQDRVGVAEGQLREANAKLLQATEFRAMVDDLLRRAPVASAAPATPHAAPARETAADRDWVARETDLAYFRFQRQFRGDEKMLRERQRRYVDVLRRHLGPTGARPRVLDLACGDGIFVEVAREAGFNARGIDINASMVRLARENDRPVERGDALEQLGAQPEGSWDAISAFQFVEHLTPDALMRLLRDARRALRPGGVLVLETLNPATFMALKWFHFDPTHERLVFPQVLELMMETAGFAVPEWKAINPPDDRERLAAVDDAKTQAAVERLNDLLFGEQDYYMVGMRPKGA